jgi:Ca2+-binding RTX toxin-like protein
MEFLVLTLLGLGIILDISGAFGKTEEENAGSNGDSTDGGGPDQDGQYSTGRHWTGPGDDNIMARASAKVHAGDGDDQIFAYGDATIFGGMGDDEIVAKNAGPTYGEAGNDSIDAFRGTSFGNDGDDTMFAYWDADVYGGRGQDVIDISGTGIAYGGSGGDHITTIFQGIGHGDAGNDTIYAGGESWGDEGDDQFTIALSGNSTLSIYGGSGNDTMIGDGPRTSTIYGGAGDDLMVTADLVLFGDDGNDTLISRFEGFATLFGGNGNDILTGEDAYGGAGDDTIFASFGKGYGDLGNDSIAAKFSYGGAGDDVLRLETFSGEGFGSNAEAYGGDGNDTLYGFANGFYDPEGTKLLSGGAGDDVIHAAWGERIDAGAGNDTVFAKDFDLAETQDILLGDGADYLVMSLGPDQTFGDFGGNVLVKDFNPTTDQLALIVMPSDLAGLSYSITPNLGGNYTEFAFADTDSGQTMTYRFDGVIALSAAHISLYANDAAVTLNQPYRTLA